MLNEKASDDFRWKDKLENIESLPGEAFNKEAAWEKLHGRMQGKRTNRRVLWYRAVAACLLFVLVIPWLFIVNKKREELVKNNSAVKQTHQLPSLSLPKNSSDIPAVVSALPAKEKITAHFPEKHDKINTLFKQEVMQLKAINDKKEKDEYIKQEIIATAAIRVDTTINIVANIPEKKKLRVVHINELGDPFMESPNIINSREHRSLVKFINQEVNISLPSSGNTGFNIFTTKNVPSN